MSRYIPADVRRELRQEANFGCAICGVPLIEYHHIIPYNEKKHHDPEHMIALCPTHHRPSDDEAIDREELYRRKKYPKNTEDIDYMFYYSTNLPEIEISSCGILFSEPAEATILRIRDNDIISAKFKENRLLFSVNFHSQSGDLIAKIDDNEWWADADALWDLKYKSNAFKIWNGEQKLGFKVVHDPDTGLITLTGTFHYFGGKVSVHPSRIIIPHSNSQIQGINILIGSKDIDSIRGGPSLRKTVDDLEGQSIIYIDNESSYLFSPK